MRLSSVFELLEQADPKKIYVIGDSHAVAIGANISGAVVLAKNGARTPSVRSQAQGVPEGSQVVVSTGNNDVGSPQGVSTQIRNMVQELIKRKCVVVYVSFPPIDLDSNRLSTVANDGSRTQGKIAVMASGKSGYRMATGAELQVKPTPGTPPLQKLGRLPVAELYRSAGYTEAYNQLIKDILSSLRNTDATILELKNSDINPADPMQIHATGTAYSRVAGQAKSSFEQIASTAETENTGDLIDTTNLKPDEVAALDVDNDGTVTPEDLQDLGVDTSNLMDYASAEGDDMGGIFAPYFKLLSQEKGMQLDTENPIIQGAIERGRLGTTLPQGSLGRASAGNNATNAVLDWIGQHESGGNYNMVNGGSIQPLTTMTIDRLLQLQQNYRQWPRASSSAAGKYQYIRSTLKYATGIMGVNTANQLFDKEFQDRLAVSTLQRRCKLNEWLNGSVSDGDFLNLVSRVWASIPNTGGSSTYRGVGNNRALVSATNSLQFLASLRQSGGTDVADVAPGDVRITNGMNPLFSLSGTQSRMVKANAGQLMQDTLNRYRRMVTIAGFPVSINDAIAKRGTSRERETPGSQHFHGRALDLSVRGLSNEQKITLVKAALRVGFKGFGFGAGILHVDTGPRRTWDYGVSSFGGYKISSLNNFVRNYGSTSAA